LHCVKAGGASTELSQFYAEHVVVHAVIPILPDTHRGGHHLEHVLCHDTLVVTILADVSEPVERQIVCGGSDLANIRFQTNIRWCWRWRVVVMVVVAAAPLAQRVTS
jgi:hypothetical protein